MGYNTRRVSLSLPSLGIQLPGSNAAARANHRSAPTSAATTPSAGISKPSSDAHPAKRVKRSHTLTTIPSVQPRTSLPSRPRKSSSISTQPARLPPSSLQQLQQTEKQQQPPRPSLLGTPPPSPRNHDSVKLDTQGINDDIVVAVLQQLESTGNRPHLIKELVAVLITTLPSVESSQNPTAIISSRLTNYLKRPWTALAPCPLAKEQVTVHPRRVYYFLTNTPRQEIPEYVDTLMASRHVISPSVSSGPDEEEDMQFRMTTDRSPSPEIDFSSLDDMTHQHNPLADMFNDEPPEAHQVPRERRLASPPLEHDEREFTQTASVMQLRKQSEQAEQKQQQLLQEQLEQTSLAEATSKPDTDSTFDPSFPSTREQGAEEESTAEETALHNQEAAALLFGQSHHHFLQSPDLSSPLMRPLQTNYASLSIAPSTPRKPLSVVDVSSFGADMDVNDSTMLDAFGAWGDLKSPENVELAELDDMFGGF